MCHTNREFVIISVFWPLKAHTVGAIFPKNIKNDGHGFWIILSDNPLILREVIAFRNIILLIYHQSMSLEINGFLIVFVKIDHIRHALVVNSTHQHQINVIIKCEGFQSDVLIALIKKELILSNQFPLVFTGRVYMNLCSIVVRIYSANNKTNAVKVFCGHWGSHQWHWNVLEIYVFDIKHFCIFDIINLDCSDPLPQTFPSRNKQQTFFIDWASCLTNRYGKFVL